MLNNLWLPLIDVLTLHADSLRKANSLNLLKTSIKCAANKLGFDIVKIPKFEESSQTYPYEEIRPFATYSPWRNDSLFQKALAYIQGYTLVDKYRCFELWKLVEQSAKLSNGSILEVGVWRGGTGALIAKQAKNLGISDRVILCDTFTGVVKSSEKDAAYTDGVHADTSRQIVEKLIFQRMKLDNVEILEGIFPEQTSHRIKGLQFRLCHIDVDIYQSAKDIVHWIWDKMVPGGIIVFDDYGFEGCGGITSFVEEQRSCKDRLVIHNLNGHAIVIKLDGIIL